MNRRQLLIGGPAAVAAVSLDSFGFAEGPRDIVTRRTGGHRWESYGADPLASSYEEAIGKFRLALRAFVREGVITTEVADALWAIRETTNAQQGSLRRGDRLNATMFRRNAPIVQRDVEIAWPPGFVVTTAEWKVVIGGRTFRLILPIRGEGVGKKIETCYNWSLKIERVVVAECDDYVLSVDLDRVPGGVKLVWNWWRVGMSGEELLADPCLCVRSVGMASCSKPVIGCNPCPPTWSYTGSRGPRGTPALIFTTVMAGGSGTLKIPRKFLLSNTELLVCSQEEPFRSPDARKGEGYAIRTFYPGGVTVLFKK